MIKKVKSMDLTFNAIVLSQVIIHYFPKKGYIPI